VVSSTAAAKAQSVGLRRDVSGAGGRVWVVVFMVETRVRK
jgi:hypothetical protein